MNTLITGKAILITGIRGGKAIKTILNKIFDELLLIERLNDVQILYACESGSRAWGFESKDSDYDVRFIYLKKSEWYLTTWNRTVEKKRDVIERPIVDELDISGWDVTKVLQLLEKSNPPLLEWLQSPTVYIGSSFSDRLRALIDDYYSPKSCMYHYLHMAEKNLKGYLKGKEVWTKKYFYVLRPILACRWIERGLGVVPVEFSRLVDVVVEDSKVSNEIESLLIKKREGVELGRGDRNQIISEFIESELNRLDSKVKNFKSEKPKKRINLDRFFVDTLIEFNGNKIFKGLKENQ